MKVNLTVLQKKKLYDKYEGIPLVAVYSDKYEESLDFIPTNLLLFKDMEGNVESLEEKIEKLNTDYHDAMAKVDKSLVEIERLMDIINYLLGLKGE